MSAIFVFGSNLAGRHGAGAALWARRNAGAVPGKGEGIQGQSYAIPTKDRYLRTLSLNAIEKNVETFRLFASRHPALIFNVTPIGCGLAGYTPEQIAPFFANMPANVVLPQVFKDALATTTVRLFGTPINDPCMVKVG